MKIQLKDTTIGLITTTDNEYTTGWVRLLNGNNPIDGITETLTSAVDEAVQRFESKPWAEAKKKHILDKIHKDYQAGKCDGACFAAYRTKSDEYIEGFYYLDFRVWNNYPATLVNCNMSTATHAMLLGDGTEFRNKFYDEAHKEGAVAPNGTVFDDELSKLYLFNRKEISFRNMLLNVLNLKREYCDELCEHINQRKAETIMCGPLFAPDAECGPINMFPINAIFTRTM